MVGGAEELTFRSEIIIAIRSKVGERDIFIIDDVAIRCIREVALGTEGGEGDEAKPLERTKRKSPNIFKRDGKGMNPFIVSLSYVNVDHLPEEMRSALSDGQQAPDLRLNQVRHANRLGIADIHQIIYSVKLQH